MFVDMQFTTFKRGTLAETTEPRHPEFDGSRRITLQTSSRRRYQSLQKVRASACYGLAVDIGKQAGRPALTPACHWLSESSPWARAGGIAPAPRPLGGEASHEQPRADYLFCTGSTFTGLSR